jgi:hypothetical protein
VQNVAPLRRRPQPARAQSSAQIVGNNGGGHGRQG